jgi:riboflavin synthase
MFTGITEERGIVKEMKRGSLFFRLTIGCRRVLEGTKVGDSIAVNGICLTVTDMAEGSLSADVMPETMRHTSLHLLSVSSPVNLERALRLSDRLGGHLVSGHIDGVGKLTKRAEENNAIWLTVEAPEDILKFLVPKGSVALDGISLTVARIYDKAFAVSIIPHTAKSTTLGERHVGDLLNIECDLIGKYVYKLMTRNDAQTAGQSQKVTEEFLRENGFA